ncbi:MAG: hypothetical protein P8Z79_11975 [Sedimentisphaerales bacterium]|jgi:hypothetical protein
MDRKDEENLRELCARFFDAEQVESWIEDYDEAEQMLRDSPAPRPDDTLVAGIKAEIAMCLRGRRVRHVKRVLVEAVGVAAAIVILASVSVRVFKKSDIHPRDAVYTSSLLPTALWESDDIAADDTDLVVFTAEIEQIEHEVTTLESGEPASENESSLTELETEYAEISSDFWKG